MNTNYEKNNNVHVMGVVESKPEFSHALLGEGFYDLRLQVPRLSNENDILPITISERLIENIKIGDKLSIFGQFRSYNKMDGGRNKLMLTVFAKEITSIDENENPNIIFLTGFICKEPIYRTTPFGREICDVLIAVNRAYNKSDYIPCIAWGRNARFVRDLAVGDKVELSGRIQSREYQKKIDETISETRTAYEVSISAITLVNEIENE